MNACSHRNALIVNRYSPRISGSENAQRHRETQLTMRPLNIHQENERERNQIIRLSSQCRLTIGSVQERYYCGWRVPV